MILLKKIALLSLTTVCFTVSAHALPPLDDHYATVENCQAILEHEPYLHDAQLFELMGACWYHNLYEKVRGKWVFLPVGGDWPGRYGPIKSPEDYVDFREKLDDDFYIIQRKRSPHKSWFSQVPYREGTNRYFHGHNIKAL